MRLSRVARCAARRGLAGATFAFVRVADGGEAAFLSVAPQGVSEQSGSQHRLPAVAVPVCWILDNDAAVVHTSGQRTQSLFDRFPAADVSLLPRLRSALLVDNGARASFSFVDGSSATIDCDRFAKYALRGPLSCAGTEASGSSRVVTDASQLERVPFDAFTAADNGEVLALLARDGLLLVEGCPDADDSVLRLGRAVDVVLPTLYGTHWSVRSAPREGPHRNIAYSAEFLDFHQDLAYYEAMPGLQLLHCRRFDDSVTGGDSFFLDGFLLGETVRERHPEAFEALCRLPVAFMKDDMNRPNPAQYYYQTTHFHVAPAVTPPQMDSASPSSSSLTPSPLAWAQPKPVITKVFWSPAFEAPLPLHAELPAYYAARRCVQNVIEELRRTSTVRFRMRPGQAVVFQQNRVLHGRDAFVEPTPGARELHGCYVCGDAFWNRVAVHHWRVAGEVRRDYRFATRTTG